MGVQFDRQDQHWRVVVGWKSLVAAVCIIAAATAVYISHNTIRRLTDERDRYKGNTETLLSDVERYRVRDSLSAARVQSLELTINEFERFRAEDAKLIRELKQRNRDLQSVSDAQSETIIHLQAIPRDTVVIIRDSIRTPAVAVHCGDAWYDFDGWLAEGQFMGELKNRDSILLAETVKYRRFLGFLWKTRRVDERTLQAVSRNPHTTIQNLEHVVIEN